MSIVEFKDLDHCGVVDKFSNPYEFFAVYKKILVKGSKIAVKNTNRKRMPIRPENYKNKRQIRKIYQDIQNCDLNVLEDWGPRVYVEMPDELLDKYPAIHYLSVDKEVIQPGKDTFYYYTVESYRKRPESERWNSSKMDK